MPMKPIKKVAEEDFISLPSEVVKASDLNSTIEEAPSASGCFVRYVPPSPVFGERTITSSDWRSIDVEAPDRTWNQLNNFQIPEESFSDAELDYLETDGGFEIVEV